jgi:hypothetical protein
MVVCNISVWMKSALQIFRFQLNLLHYRSLIKGGGLSSCSTPNQNLKKKYFFRYGSMTYLTGFALQPKWTTEIGRRILHWETGKKKKKLRKCSIDLKNKMKPRDLNQVSESWNIYLWHEFYNIFLKSNINYIQPQGQLPRTPVKILGARLDITSACRHESFIRISLGVSDGELFVCLNPFYTYLCPSEFWYEGPACTLWQLWGPYVWTGLDCGTKTAHTKTKYRPYFQVFMEITACFLYRFADL